MFLNEYAARNFRNPKVAMCVDLMWTCLEHYVDLAQVFFDDGLRGALDKEIVDFEYTLYVLKDVLLKLLHQGYRLADKELRNELVIILTILAKFPRSLPCFIQSGLLNLLLTYSTVSEAGKDGWVFYVQPLAKIRNFGTVFDIDLHLKRELWVLLSDLMSSDDEDVILTIAASPLVELLLIYLEKSSIDSHSSPYRPADVHSTSLLPKERQTKELNQVALEFSLRAQGPDSIGGLEEVMSLKAVAHTFISTVSTPQLKEFQVIAIVFLAEHANRLLGEFMRVDGILRVLQLVHMYWSSSVEEHRAILFHAMILLNKCALAMPSVVKPILEYQNVVKVHLDIFGEIDEEYIRSQAARLISNLCKGSPESLAQLRQMNGISLFVRAINEYSAGRRVRVGKKACLKFEGEKDSAVPELDDDEKPGGDISIFIIAG